MIGISSSQYVKTVHLSVFLLTLCAGILLAACEDATNVGEDLVGAQGGHPEIKEIPVTDLRAGDLIRPANVFARVLAGRVDDPALGTYSVDGYLDVTPVTSEEFRAQPVEHVELRLEPAYVYGDTTSEITLALRQVTEAWDPVGLPTDTSFSAGSIIREFTFTPTDSLVVIEMPESWIQENDEVLRSTDVGDLFHGFRLDPVSGNAVVGFGPNGTNLVAQTADDSLTFPMGLSYSSVERTMPVELPPDRFLMQAGAGPIATFSFTEVGAGLPPSSINRATITVWADTLIGDGSLPDHFVRPTLERLDLYGITDNEESVLLAQGNLNDQGQLVFDARALAAAIQDMAMGKVIFERFEIRLPNPIDPITFTAIPGDARFYYTSLNPIVFYSAAAAEKVPAGFVTLTPLD